MKIIPTGPGYTLLQAFCFEIARLQAYVAITSYALLHQSTRSEGENSLRECRDILVSACDPQQFFFII